MKRVLGEFVFVVFIMSGSVQSRYEGLRRS